MRAVVAVLNALLVVVYPLAVYVGLTHLRTRELGLLLMLLLLPGLIGKLRAAKREDLAVTLRLPLSVLTLLGLSALLNDARFVLALPVLINLSLLLQFASSLRGTPMVERVARMQDPQLGAAQIGYCRTVTKVWCGFFVLNGAVSAALAAWAPLSWWTLYTGLVSYGLLATLAAAEYVARKFRFREYGTGLHDRILARVFPPRTGVAP